MRAGAVEEGEPSPGAMTAAGKRRQAREMALQMLYQQDLAGSSPEQIFRAFDQAIYALETAPPVDERPAGDEVAARKRQQAFAYAQRLVRGTLEHLTQIDQWLAAQAEHWRLARMPAVDRNILRLAVFELAFEPDVPKVVILDEAIELAKKFGSEQSSAFVNGVLDGLLRERDFPGRLH